MRGLGHATQDAALRCQHATDERDRVLAAGIDNLIRAARGTRSGGRRSPRAHGALIERYAPAYRLLASRAVQ